MASDKRERQRQNRASKQAELNKQQRKQKLFSTIRRVGIWAIVFVILVILANAVWA